MLGAAAQPRAGASTTVRPPRRHGAAAATTLLPVRLAVVEIAPFGGLLHYAVQLGDALAARGDDVDLILPTRHELEGRPGPARRLQVLPPWLPPPESDSTPARVFVRRARSAAWRVATWARILRSVRRGRYDAVILNGSIDLSLSAVAAFALIKLSGRARVTHVCHNVRPFNRWGGDDLFVSSPAMLGLLRRLYPAFDLVFVHGEASREEFERTWPGARLAVIPHGDEGIFTGDAPPPADEPRILFFGDWRKVKGLRVLMEAFDAVRERVPAARLTIAGSPSPEEGEDEAVLAWAAARADHVTVDARYVPVEEVPPLFASARVVALPYLVGYQSGVLHLAMTMGRAVVATRVGDLASVVADGETGRLVEPGDAAALADALVDVLADPERAARMGEAGRARLAAEASWPAVADQVDDALQRILR